MPPCSGLIVTSFYKDQIGRKLDVKKLFPSVIVPYDKYKKITKIPDMNQDDGIFLNILPEGFVFLINLTFQNSSGRIL